MSEYFPWALSCKERTLKIWRFLSIEIVQRVANKASCHNDLAFTLIPKPPKFVLMKQSKGVTHTRLKVSKSLTHFHAIPQCKKRWQCVFLLLWHIKHLSGDKGCLDRGICSNSLGLNRFRIAVHTKTFTSNETLTCQNALVKILW